MTERLESVISRRLELMDKVAAYKEKNGLPLRDLKREAAIIEGIKRHSDKPWIQEVFRTLFHLSVARQEQWLRRSNNAPVEEVACLHAILRPELNRLNATLLQYLKAWAPASDMTAFTANLIKEGLTEHEANALSQILSQPPLKWSANMGDIVTDPCTKEWASSVQRVTESFARQANKVYISSRVEQWAPICPEDKAYLGVTNERAWCRWVVINGDDEPWCFAKVLVPESTYKKFKSEFDELKDNLLGQSILYQHPNMKRSGFEFAQLKSGSALFAQLQSMSKGAYLAQTLCARRSVFHLDEYPLLLEEIFLPMIPEVSHAKQ